MNDALIEVPCHPALAEHLATLPKSGMMLVLRNGRPVKYRRFNTRFRVPCALAGIAGAQARDLRRTAMVRMAEGGATVPQIAAVSGHKIEAPQRILGNLHTSKQRNGCRRYCPPAGPQGEQGLTR
jgi:integrase